jgi:glycosyltransferase involved in cell wall biosynthesis
MNDVKAFFQIKKLIKEYQPDIVHTHAAKAGALGRIAAHQCGVPIILHTFHGHVFHSYFNPIKTQAFIQIERYLASISTKIIAISDLQKKELTKDFKICDDEKMEVIPLGFDLQKFANNQHEKRIAFRKKYNVDDDEIVISLVGRLVPVKNHSLFIKAIKIISEKTNKKVRFFIVGDGEERLKIEQEAAENNLSFTKDNFEINKAIITFTSWIKDVDVVNAGSDIIALTSFNEGTPVSIIEAQASKRAVVSTMVGGIKDIVEEGKTALLSNSGDVEKFAENLLMLIENEHLREKFGENGGETVFKKFSYQRLVSDIEKLYNQLIEK